MAWPVLEGSKPFPVLKLSCGLFLALLPPLAGVLLTHAPPIWPLSTLLYGLGLLLGCALLRPGSVRNLVYRLLAIPLFLLEAAFFFSFYLQDTGFNRAFFYHLRLDLLHAGIRDYFPQLLLLGCCGLGFLLLCGAVLRRQQVLRFRWFPVALGLLICGGYLSPPLNELLRSVRGGVARVEGAQRWEHFGELREARPRAVFTGSRRPNLVLIYAESLEQRFFDETLFPGLLPHLQRLAEQSTAFTDVAQGVGAGWTIAGMVASQCGYPLAPSHDVGGNDLSLFEDFLPKATCLGDILARDGYQLTFMGGADARFAGKGAFLRSHGYTQIIDRDMLLESLADPAYVHGWGVFDDTLFERAYDQFLRLSRQQTPFLLTLLTLDTHNPNGFLSSSCGNYGTGDNSFLNSVHCSDLLISRFVERIRNSPDSDNTIIIVLSDHLALRNRATPLLERSRQPSRLLFLVNTPEGKKGVNANPGLHYDIAPTILDLLGYELSGQLGFGASLTRGAGYLPGKFGMEGWRRQEEALLAIGAGLWNHELKLDREGIRFFVSSLALEMGGRRFNLRSGGVSADIPASTLLFFDPQSFALEQAEVHSFDRDMTTTTLSRKLLQQREKLAFVISRAGNLPGFVPDTVPFGQWVFYLGRPGSRTVFWKPIAGDFSIAPELVAKLARQELDEGSSRERQALLRALTEAKRQE